MISGRTPLTIGKTGRLRPGDTEADYHILDIGEQGKAGTVTFLTVYDWRVADRGGERRKGKNK